MSVLPVGFGSATNGGGFNVERSLRFNSADSAYLNRTPGSASNRKTWTWSGWVKRGQLGSRNIFFAAGGAGNNFGLEFSANNELDTYQYVAGYQWQLISSSVYRDVSAWYHIVLALDTTQATSTNRVKLYVNGVQVTAFSTSTYPTQNTDYLVNSTNQHNISNVSGASLYMDGYMTEVNFIDGQALTPSSFGETDANTGVWKPKAFSGTYGTNGFYLPFKTASQWSGYFDGNADYLSVPHNSSLSPTGDFTIEFWAYTGSTAVQEWVTKGLGIQIYSYLSNWYVALSSSNNATYFINGSFGVHSTNTWQHIAISRQGNTYRGFVNGVATTLGTSSSAPSTGTDSLFVGAIGVGGTPYYATGYLSNLRIVNGTAVYTGTFTPPTSQLTAITNTSLLTCQSSTFVDNSTNAFTITANGDTRPQQFSPFTLDVTDDHSGQGNHWQPNNLDLRTTGVGADILVDSPTSYGTDTGVGGTVRGNYCTWNPLSTGRTLSNGNLDYAGSASGVAKGTLGVSSGKWYWEILANGANSSAGVASVSLNPTTSYCGATADSWCLFTSGDRYNNGSATSGYSTFTTNDIIGVALDMDNGKVYWAKNGVWQGSSDPVTGTNAGYTNLSGYTITPANGNNNTNDLGTANFGQRAFAYTAPSGFKALCTQNLPTPTIGATSTTQANDYMNVVLYSGNSSTQNITGVGFAPDFTWLKVRNDAQNHRLFDTVRGANKRLMSSSTAAEATTTDELTAFGSDGFTLGANTDVNGTGFTYVSWNWKANGAGSSNTAGTITSTVSANTTSGFSIVTYTGTGANATVGHGLGVAPDMVIVKGRNTINLDWVVYHRSLTSASYALFLNATNAQTLGTTYWNSTAPTSTVFSVGADNNTNKSATTYVAYCFDAVAGYSAFGSYTGTGNTDGPFVYTGFRPRFVLTKQSSSTSNWSIHDTSRAPYNLTINNLYPDASDAEYTGTSESFDFLSNGFKPRSAGTPTNASGGTYIYMAFAESPFKYALAR